MLFLFNLIYASTWGTVAFLIPTEIFPSRMRAQGNGFGITGWAIGVGWTVLVNPIMFENIQVCYTLNPHISLRQTSIKATTNSITESHLFPLCRIEFHLDRNRLPDLSGNCKSLA